MPKKAKRFLVLSKNPNGTQKERYSTDSVVEAWDYYAFFSKRDPLNEVEILDREEDVEARVG